MHIQIRTHKSTRIRHRAAVESIVVGRAQYDVILLLNAPAPSRTRFEKKKRARVRGRAH